ncbi:alpha/beta hydrolase fold-3 domain-containing protein [Xylaria digitata]|nr:alpha/beta hydrolase fold-3 domain-containing protein [Xylaria digitata]
MDRYDTLDKLAELSVQDPEFSQYLESDAEKPPFLFSSLQQLREVVVNHPFPVPEESENEYTFEIPTRDGHQSNIRVYEPKVRQPNRALIVLIHGGGFCLGHNSHVRGTAQDIVSAYNATVLSVSYRFAPEFKFPVAAHDIYDNMEWIAKNAEAKLGVNLAAGFILGGVSAGSNLAAVVAQKWLSANKIPKMTGTWLALPLIFDEAIVPAKFKDSWVSREQNPEALILGQKDLLYLKVAYSPDVFSADFSPFNADGAHIGLPPTYFQICGQDPLRDDGLIYEKVLRDHGVTTKLDVYPGFPHGFAELLPTLKTSKKYRLDTQNGFGWLLKQEPSPGGGQ